MMLFNFMWHSVLHKFVMLPKVCFICHEHVIKTNFLNLSIREKIKQIHSFVNLFNNKIIHFYQCRSTKSLEIKINWFTTKQNTVTEEFRGLSWVYTLLPLTLTCLLWNYVRVNFGIALLVLSVQFRIM